MLEKQSMSIFKQDLHFINKFFYSGYKSSFSEKSLEKDGGEREEERREGEEEGERTKEEEG